MRPGRLGEFIIQLAGEKPSHILAPAIHRDRAQVAELFERTLGAPPGLDPEGLVAWARKVLRDRFLAADAGITGANFAVAETGTLVLVERDHDAVAAKDDLHVEPGAGEHGLEEVPPLAGRLREQPTNRVFRCQLRERVSGVLLIQATREQRHLAPRLQREASPPGRCELLDAGLTDLFFLQGRFLGVIDPAFLLVGMLGLIMTGLGLIGNLARLERRVLFIELDALALIATYCAGLWLLYSRGVTP